MKKMKMSFIVLFAMSLTLLTIASCKKNDDNNTTQKGTAKVSMHLTDDPANYDAVYIDIKSIEVTVEGSSAVSIAPIRPGIYNLLKFRNGLDTLLARADISAGKVGQIRLILGDNNAVVVGGISYPLNTPSAQESGLKLNINQTFVAGGAYDMWLDFDAGKSIHQTGNGKYMLKPVIKAYSQLTDGRIKGYVLPVSALVTVYATNGVDTYSAIPAVDGFYMFTGLPEGTYQLTYDAAIASFIDITIPNVQAKYGTTVDLGITTLLP